MNKTKPKLDKSTVTDSIKKLRKYSWLVLILFFIILYALMIINIESYKSAQPSQTAVNNDLQTTSQPSINPDLIKKLNQLKNKSVSVRALFNQNRQNPF